MSDYRREILYLHGLGSSPASAKGRLIEKALGKSSNGTDAAPEAIVHLPDLNVPSFEALSVVQVVEHARALVAALIAPERIIVGSSFGAFVALHALSTFDRNVREVCTALVLLAPAIDPWDPNSRLITPDVRRMWREQGRFPLFSACEERDVEVHLRFLDELERFAAAPSTLPLPTLLVHGTRDEVVHHSQSVMYAESNPHAQVHLVDDTHDLMADPPSWLSEVESFLRSSTGSSGRSH